jgi:hypothetical protein
LYYQQLGILVHNVLTGKKFNNFKFGYNSSERSSRWPELLEVKRVRIGLGQRSIYYEGAKCFNIIPTDVKHTQNANIFKKNSSHYGYFKTITLTKSLPPTPSIELTEFYKKLQTFNKFLL